MSHGVSPAAMTLAFAQTRSVCAMSWDASPTLAATRCARNSSRKVTRFCRAHHPFARDPAAGDLGSRKPSLPRLQERRECRRMDHAGLW